MKEESKKNSFLLPPPIPTLVLKLIYDLKGIANEKKFSASANGQTVGGLSIIQHEESSILIQQVVT